MKEEKQQKLREAVEAGKNYLEDSMKGVVFGEHVLHALVEKQFQVTSHIARGDDE